MDPDGISCAVFPRTCGGPAGSNSAEEWRRSVELGLWKTARVSLRNGRGRTGKFGWLKGSKKFLCMGTQGVQRRPQETAAHNIQHLQLGKIHNFWQYNKPTQPSQTKAQSHSWQTNKEANLLRHDRRDVTAESVSDHGIQGNRLRKSPNSSNSH